MELINATRMVAGYNMGLEPSGRELLVVVIKGTFVLPRPGEPIRLHDEQVPLIMADSFGGDPGSSAPVHEIDFAPRKLACDVLLVGSAHAPEGRQMTRLRASLRVGGMEKTFDVVGNRFWEAGLGAISASAPEYFSRMPISYDRAFGGTDRNSEDPSEHDAYVVNPVGRGWHKQLESAWVDGSPLPNTEEVGSPVSHPGDASKPMALGPLGRGWAQRARFAGTYDQQWLDEVFPFLPKDFDERYHQAAPEDQQLPLPQGPLQVMLDGFTPDGPRHFVLPHFEAPVLLYPKRGERETHSGRLDTIVFEPDQERLTLTWRVTRPLQKSMFEIAQVRIGITGRERWDRPALAAFPRPAATSPADAEDVGAPAR